MDLRTLKSFKSFIWKSSFILVLNYTSLCNDCQPSQYVLAKQHCQSEDCHDVTAKY